MTELRRNMAVVICFGCLMLAMGASGQEAAVATQGQSNVSASVKEDAHRLWVVAKIKAAWLDRKDIPGRYIRVRHDGNVVLVAGFVPDKETAAAAQEIARGIAKPAEVRAVWGIDPEIARSPRYTTYLGQQAEDVRIAASVKESLGAADVKPQLKDAEIVQVDAKLGHVIVYILADAPPGEFDLAPHVDPIPGVKSFKTRVVRTFEPAPQGSKTK